MLITKLWLQLSGYCQVSSRLPAMAFYYVQSRLRGFPRNHSKALLINEFRCYEVKIEESEKAGSCRELNPGHLWLEPPVLCHWATTARQPQTLTILYMYFRLSWLNGQMLWALLITAGDLELTWQFCSDKWRRHCMTACVITSSLNTNCYLAHY